MAYTINFSDPSTPSFSIGLGSVDGPGYPNQHTSLTLPGAKRADYGETFNESLVHMLEHFAHPGSDYRTPNAVSLSKAVTGQLWFNTSNNLLMQYNGSTWRAVKTITTTATAPLDSVFGELWADPNTNSLKMFDGTTFTHVADGYVKANGTVALTGHLNLGSFKITDLAAPTSPLDAVNKAYVDAYMVGTGTTITIQSGATSFPASTVEYVGATVTNTAVGKATVTVSYPLDIRDSTDTSVVVTPTAIQFARGVTTATSGKAIFTPYVQVQNLSTAATLSAKDAGVIGFSQYFVNQDASNGKVKIAPRQLRDAQTFAPATGFGGTITRSSIGALVFFKFSITALPASSSNLTSIQSNTLLGTIRNFVGLDINNSFIDSAGFVHLSIASADGVWPISISTINGEVRNLVTMQRAVNVSKDILTGNAWLPCNML